MSIQDKSNLLQLSAASTDATSALIPSWGKAMSPAHVTVTVLHDVSWIFVQPALGLE